MLRFHQVPAFGGTWDVGHASRERFIYHTDAWLRFVAEARSAEPVRAELRDGDRVIGHVTGLVVTVLGARIFGSPLPGWTTLYMGFVLDPGVPRRDAIDALRTFVFGPLRCVHLGVGDTPLLAVPHDHVDSYENDLTRSEDELFAAMDSACRRCIRKAEKGNVAIEEVDSGDRSFAGEFYAQLAEVFRRQGLVPTYGPERVRALIDCLSGTGQLLLLRARNPDGACIATGIYPGMNRLAQFWGNASVRAEQHRRPNEALNWHAMRYWKRRGAEVFDWGGGGDYKIKYGCAPIQVPRVRASKHALFARARDAALKAFEGRQRLLGLLGTARSWL
jgi:hypothetical protein